MQKDLLKMHGFLLWLFAMSVTTGCKTAAYFASPNNVSKKEAVVTMLDSSERKGLLTITLETNYSPANFIKLVSNGKEENIPIDQVRSYRISDDIYVPKKLVLEYEGQQQLLFVKRLMPENSRIQVYELYQDRLQRDDAQNLILYFISLPGFDRLEAWGLGNKNLVPNFNEKMSRIVADCPALANKISNKEKGYFFSGLTLSNITKGKVLRTIVEEYNKCR